MDTKGFIGVEIKSEVKGEVRAVFSTLNVRDKDGDITLPGAFRDGAETVISAYGHTSHMELGGRMPVGKGRIRTTAKEAILDGQFFLDTTHGRDAFLTVKQLGPLGQWSYGYDVLDADYGEVDGKAVRYLKSLAVLEVSPVLVGVGVNTRTLATKGLSPDHVGGAPVGFEYKAAIKPHDTEVNAGAWDAGKAVKSIPADASVSDLRSMYAWVDSDADPEVKSSYKFPHHTGVDGPANIRACIVGIAALNGARGGTSVPEADRKGVYNHLAAHLRDADREPPELRSGSADGLKFNDEMSLVLCEVGTLLDRASEVVALRARKGRTPLSLGSSELLEWLDTDLRRLKSLLTPTEDEAAIEYLRFLRATIGEQT
jgi:Caudovirus prohead serine protease